MHLAKLQYDRRVKIETTKGMLPQQIHKNFSFFKREQHYGAFKAKENTTDVGCICCWPVSAFSKAFLPGSLVPPQKATRPNSNSTRVDDPHKTSKDYMWLAPQVNMVIQLWQGPQSIYSFVFPRHLKGKKNT